MHIVRDLQCDVENHPRVSARNLLERPLMACLLKLDE
jgi:hypothetical protein